MTPVPTERARGSTATYDESFGRLIVVSGLHRSGTTYVGSVFRRRPEVTVFIEPLNKLYGVRGVNVEYPHVDPATGAGMRSEMPTKLEEIREFRGSWSREVPREGSLATKLAHRAFGGQNTIAWQRLRWTRRLGRKPRVVCWKDPFTTFATAFLIENLGARVVTLVRHPAALYRSYSRLNWRFDVRTLTSQRSLVEEYGDGIPDSHWRTARTEHAGAVALLWKVMSRALARWDARHVELLTVTHEELCREPESVCERIFAHSDLELDADVRRYVGTTTRGAVGENLSSVHLLKRDSRSLADSWRGKVEPRDEELLREFIGDDLHLHYETW